MLHFSVPLDDVQKILNSEARARKRGGAKSATAGGGGGGGLKDRSAKVAKKEKKTYCYEASMVSNFLCV